MPHNTDLTQIDKFDPNNDAAGQPPEWGVYIAYEVTSEGHDPYFYYEFKQIRRRHNAVTMMGRNWLRAVCGLWQYIEGNWVLVSFMHKREVCGHCKGSIRKSVHLVSIDDIEFWWENPVVCGDCWEEHFRPGAPDPIDPKMMGDGKLFNEFGPRI